jgi:hypothetical protein
VRTTGYVSDVRAVPKDGFRKPVEHAWFVARRDKKPEDL